MKQIPCDTEAEKTVLGAMMFNKEIIVDIAEIIAPDDFYHDVNGIIFRAITDLEARSITPDLITLSNVVPKYSKDIPITYIAQLIGGANTAANASHYANVIKEKSILRQLISKQNNIINRIYDESYETVQELLSDAEQSILEINNSSKINVSHVKTILLPYLDKLENMKFGISGIKTPFSKFDYATAGLQNKDLILIAARPGMGKTSFGTEIAAYSALNGLSVVFFSIEMPKEQILNRIYSQQVKVPLKKFRMGGFTSEEWDRINNMSARLNNTNLIIEDKPINILDMRAKCRRIKKQYGLDIVIIDYLQKIRGHKRTENRNHELGIISDGLKEMAKEFDIPVVSLAQLSRGVEQRSDKHPMMSDLRDSGNLEQDADMICFLYRDDYYNPNSDKKDITELVISKQRNGETGTIELCWDRIYTKLYDTDSSFSAEQLFATEA